MPKRRTLWLADLHESSIFGLAPPEYTTREGKTIGATPVQKILDAHWHDLMEDEDVQSCDSVALVGDMTEGNNYHEFGRKLTTPDLVAQKNLSLQRLRPICEGRDVFGISGSKYHRGSPYDSDEAIIRDLGGQYLGNYGYINIAGCICFLAHKAGGAKLQQTRAGALAKNRALMTLAEHEELDFPVGLMVYGHWHEYQLIESTWPKTGELRNIFCCPGFKATFDWDKTAGTSFAFKTTIGLVVTEIEDGRVTWVQPKIRTVQGLCPKVHEL